MKKCILLSALALSGVFISGSAFSQATSSTNVKIVLSDFITTENGAGTTAGQTPGAGAEVLFEYPDAASYTAVKSVNQPGHLKVTATKTFQVTVKAMGTNFVHATTPANVIPVNVVDIIPTAPGSGTASTVTLSDAEQVILSGVDPGIKTINVEYQIPAAKAQANILGKPSGTYQQVVVYTFSQP
jgi:hypothetical protein